MLITLITLYTLMSNNILVIGGSGFFGQHLIDGLFNNVIEGDYFIRVFDVRYD